MTLADEFIQELARALRLAGVDGMLVRQKSPGEAGQPVRFLVNHPTRRDEAVVNAYGINALILTFPATPELLAQPPVKFDQVIPAGPAATARPYSIDTALTRQVLGRAVAITAYVKGGGV